MAAQPSSNQSLTQKIADAQSQLYQQFPQFQSQLKSIIASSFSSTDNIPNQTEEPASSNTKKTTTPTTNIKKVVTKHETSPEEVSEVILKLKQISQLPGKTIEQESILYLEQQLADIFGFELTTQVGTVNLPFIKSTVDSLPERRFTPTDSTESESLPVPEAGRALQRSYFGWQLSQDSSSANHYWISLPLDEFVLQGIPRNQAKQLLTKHKVVVINPNDGFYAVTSVVDDYRDVSNKHQIGASPLVIRQGQFWSANNAGKALLFFLPESYSIEPGVYQFS